MTNSTKEGLLFATVVSMVLNLMFIVEKLITSRETELQAKCEQQQGVLTYTGTSGYHCVKLPPACAAAVSK